MSGKYDVVVIGAGPGGDMWLRSKLQSSGLRRQL